MSARRAALLAALACNPPATGEPAPTPPPEAAPPQPTCEEPPPGALALLSPGPGPLNPELPDRACPWVLADSGGELTVRPLGRGDAAPKDARLPIPVLPPADCQPCRFSGVVTALGPVLLATRPSAASELAGAAWLGAGLPPSPRVDSQPAPIAFAPLWFGLPGLGDSTVQGPPWALAPHLCDLSLVLLAEPRLPGARAEEPPAALVRAAGIYAAAGSELLLQDRPVPSDMSLCTRVPLELP